MAKGLTRGVLAAEALRLVDEEGLDALSMRRLAARLGVDPMAAYRHVPNKAALLDAVVEEVLTSRELQVPPGDWRAQVRSLTRQMLDLLLAHPNAVPLLAQRPWSQRGSLRAVETCLSVLLDAGIEPREALAALDATGLFLVSLAVSMTQAPAADLAGLDAAELPALTRAVAAAGVPTAAGALDFWIGAVLDRFELGRARMP